MSKLLWNVLKTTPAALGVSLLVANSTLAQSVDTNSEMLNQINTYSEEGSVSADQVTNVFQLRDVSPGDWAFEALRNLVERYGCIAGYPDSSFRGNRAMTRYEFAAGMNACLQQIERLIVGGGGGVTPEELATLKRLVQEFEAELAALGTRVDNLEGRVAFLEDHQFSTTTKLRGEVIFSANGAFGDDKANSTDNIDDNITFSDRVRLNFDTSFSGKDKLRVRLEAGNTPELDEATGTEMARLGYESNNGNDIEVNDLYYMFPVGDRVKAWIGANGFDFNDMADVHNPVLESSGTGALSRFNRRNPFIFRNSAEQGLGANIAFSDTFGLDVGYFTGDGESPAPKDGIFNGDYTAIAQFNWEPSDRISLGVGGGYSYYPGEDVNLSGSVGSPLAKRPFGQVATSAWRAGIQGSFRVTEKINVGAWGGYINAQAQSGPLEDNHADLWNWAANVSFLDLGKEGAALAFAGGMPPKASYVDGGPEDDGTSYVIEALYKYPISDNILITPGAYVVLNPNHDDDNDTVWVGTIRTTFKF